MEALTLTNSEWYVLDCLWERSPMTVMEGRAKHYTPAVERQSAARRETRSFLDRVYQGSVGLMVSSLVQDEALSREEIYQLYEILRQAEEGTK